MKKIVDEIIDYLIIIFNPNFWLMIRPYNELWDKKVNQLFDKNVPIVSEREFTMKLGKYTIWIENYPYSCLTPYESGMLEFRPSRLTILRRMRQVKKIIKDKENKKIIDYLGE